MEKKYKLKCESCHYEKEVPETEVVDSLECPICHSSMLFEYTFKQDFTFNTNVQQEKVDDVQDQNDHLLLEQVKRDIELFGEQKVWDEINNMDLEIRLNLIPIFTEAKRQLSEDI